MGQPQGVGSAGTRPTQASMGQLIGGQNPCGASFFLRPSPLHRLSGRWHAARRSGFDTVPTGQIGKKQGRARQRRRVLRRGVPSPRLRQEARQVGQGAQGSGTTADTRTAPVSRARR